METQKTPAAPVYEDPLKALTDKLEQGVTQLFASGRYESYLKTMGRFHDYSTNNTILIAMQKPDATLVAGYNAWQDKFGRHVKRGEKGIRIIAPSPVKIRKELPGTDTHGNPATEVKEITIPKFKAIAVFDVAQTDGKPLPTLGVNELKGNVAGYQTLFEALRRTSPVPIEFQPLDGDAKGFYSLTGKNIVIGEGLDEIQTVKTAIHEIAHAKLHDRDPAPKPEPPVRGISRNTQEVQAESVAYTVCQYYGIDTAEYSFGYIAGWSRERSAPELKASLEVIRAASSELIAGIDTRLSELTHEKTPAQEVRGELAAQARDKQALEKIFAEHEKWLDNESKGKKADLRGVDLTNQDLTGVDLSYADLAGADFRNAVLKGIVLVGADLSGANLCDSDLQNIDLMNANLQGAHLRGANLQNAILWSANFQNADFHDANLKDADFHRANLRDADFQGANLKGADFYRANLRDAKFQDDDFRKAEPNNKADVQKEKPVSMIQQMKDAQAKCQERQKEQAVSPPSHRISQPER